MFGCDCFHWNRSSEYHELSQLPEPFSLPAHLPQWPQGMCLKSSNFFFFEYKNRIWVIIE